jgi:Trk K+ transport system NAD-binding subunit
MQQEEVLDILQNKSLPINEIKAIYLKHKGTKEIESMIAMNLSLRTSVYDTSLEKSDTMTELLKELSASKSMEARWAVAKNPHTPIDILEQLSKDSVNLVRALVATNPNTKASTLNQFFNDEKIVRDGLSGNISTPAKLLHILAQDSDKMVRLRVADNSSTAKKTLEQLLNDSSEDVKIAAQKNLQRQEA